MEEETWNLKALREFIEQNYLGNKKEQSQLRIALDSIDAYVRIFRYHCFQVKHSLIDQELCEAEKFKLISGISEHQEEYEQKRIAGKANLIAGVHTARNIYDIFSQIVNKLILDEPMQEENCDLKMVLKNLKSSPLQVELVKLVSSESYKYVHAFSNITKHRYLIKSMPRLTFEDKMFEIEIGSFTYDKQTYPSYWIGEVLEIILAAKNQIINCGIALNDHLSLER